MPLLFLGGDFNVPAAEEKKRKLFKNIARDQWDVAFLEGCKDCKGTYYYPPKKEWSFLDALLIGKNSNSGWVFDPESVKLIRNKFQLDGQTYPKSFDLETKIGASDHLPIYAEIHKPSRK